MKRTALSVLLLLLCAGLSSMDVHKFYVSIYQVGFVPEKKMVQITSRIFIDDLNAALDLNYKKKTHIGEPDESPEDVELLKQYFSRHFTIAINGKKATINYLSKELEGNVVICYFNIREVSKITTFEIGNPALMELNPDQQNIIQTTIYGKKQSLLLKEGDVKGMLKF